MRELKIYKRFKFETHFCDTKQSNGVWLKFKITLEKTAIRLFIVVRAFNMQISNVEKRLTSKSNNRFREQQFDYCFHSYEIFENFVFCFHTTSIIYNCKSILYFFLIFLFCISLLKFLQYLIKIKYLRSNRWWSKSIQISTHI